MGSYLKAHVAVSCWAHQDHGVSLTAGPGCDLSAGGTTWVFPVWSAPQHLPVIKEC